MQQLLAQLVHFHLTVRRETAGTKTYLSLSGGQLLGEVSCLEEANINNLTKRLLLERSTVSRLVKKLVEPGFLTQEEDPRDARKKMLQLTPHGKSILKKDDLARSSVTERILRRLSAADQKKILAGFKLLADSFNIVPGIQRSGEHRLRVEQRRLTRAFGLFGERFFGSKVSISGLHIMFFLCAEGEAGLSRLCSSIPYDQSTLSRAVQKLTAQELVVQNVSPEDRRCSVLMLTRTGIRFLESISESTALHAKAHLSEKELSEFGRVLARLNLRSVDAELFQSGALRIEALEDTASLNAARTFLIEQSVNEGRHSALPSILYGRNEHAYGIFEKGELIACCQAQSEKKGEWEIRNGARDQLRVSAPGYFALIERCRSSILQKHRGSHVQISDSSLGLSKEQLSLLSGYLVSVHID